jgi:adenylyltransferase/sulfurtransferase
MLNEEERARYDRQMRIPGFGEAGQEKLKRAKVFIAGAGGLGSAAAIYLAAAGVGTIRIADPDRVELSNLNRQIIYREADIGGGKAELAAARLREINGKVKIEAVAEAVTEANASHLVADADIIVDALDNMPARYLLNRTALQKGIPFCHGAVNGFEGRAMTVIPGRTACLNCIYHGAVTPAEKTPVIGVTPAVIGCLQATEVIKYIVGTGELLTDRMLVYDARRLTFDEFKVARDPECEQCGGRSKR